MVFLLGVLLSRIMLPFLGLLNFILFFCLPCLIFLGNLSTDFFNCFFKFFHLDTRHLNQFNSELACAPCDCDGACFYFRVCLCFSFGGCLSGSLFCGSFPSSSLAIYTVSFCLLSLLMKLLRSALAFTYNLFKLLHILTALSGK